MTAIKFWAEHIGRRLDDSIADPETTAVTMPHRTLKGVKPLRIGAIDAFYIVSPSSSELIGRIEKPDQPGLVFVPTESVSARKYMAEWLVSVASVPFMVGVIGNANPNESMRISHTLDRCYFCEAGGGFSFSLEKVRRANALFSGLRWKQEVAPAIHQYQRFRLASGDEQMNQKDKLQKMLASNPGLREALVQSDVRPDSGEYTILSWLNIEKAA